MTNQLMRWHLARDNQLQLSRFCDKHQVHRVISPYYKHDGDDSNYFAITTIFDNQASITAESKQGGSLNDDYQVLDVRWGTA